jgi:hypothetical protein
LPWLSGTAKATTRDDEPVPTPDVVIVLVWSKLAGFSGFDEKTAACPSGPRDCQEFASQQKTPPGCLGQPAGLTLLSSLSNERG